LSNVPRRGAFRTWPAYGCAQQNVPRLGVNLDWVFLYTDAPERSLETLEFNLESGLPGAAILPLLWRPFYERKTERFKAYVRGLGLVDYWKAKGWPSSAIPPPPTISSAIDELRPDNQALPLRQLMAKSGLISA
jgi:hypothetical protein